MLSVHCHTMDSPTRRDEAGGNVSETESRFSFLYEMLITVLILSDPLWRLHLISRMWFLSLCRWLNKITSFMNISLTDKNLLMQKLVWGKRKTTAGGETVKFQRWALEKQSSYILLSPWQQPAEIFPSSLAFLALLSAASGGENSGLLAAGGSCSSWIWAPSVWWASHGRHRL